MVLEVVFETHCKRLAQIVFAQTHEVSNVYLNRLEVKHLNEALNLS